MQECRVLVNFFCVKGIKKKKGYLVDSIILPIGKVSPSSEIDYFRGRSKEFDATINSLKDVSLSCYMFLKGRVYRIASFSILKPNDEIYVCEARNKEQLQQFLIEDGLSQAPPPVPAISIQRVTSVSENATSAESEQQVDILKRKRNDSLKEKLRNHITFVADPDYKNGSSRQQYLERETVNAFREYKGMSLTEFHNEYNNMKWKTCKCIKNCNNSYQ